MFNNITKSMRANIMKKMNNLEPQQEPQEQQGVHIADVNFLMDQIAASIDTIFITEPITLESATRICKQLFLIEERNKLLDDYVKPINMVINSPGGCLHSSLMITDVMDIIKTPVHTFAFGMVASGAFIIYMNGERGHRSATKNTRFLSHRFSITISGNHADLMSFKREIDDTHTMMINHYQKCTNMTKKQIEDILLTEHDAYLSANECKKYKIVDKIVMPKKKAVIK